MHLTRLCQVEAFLHSLAAEEMESRGTLKAEEAEEARRLIHHVAPT